MKKKKYITCSTCGRKYRCYPAISRKDNLTKICPICGIDEALNTIPINPVEKAKILADHMKIYMINGDILPLKSEIFPRLISKKQFIEKAKSENVVYTNFLDLYVIFSILIVHENTKYVLFDITKEMLQTSHTTVNHENSLIGLLNQNLLHYRKYYPPLIERIDGSMIHEQFKDAISSNIFVLSNKPEFYGATEIIDQSVLRDVAKTIGTSFTIIPSSVHKVLLIPDSISISAVKLQNFLNKKNSFLLSPDEFLSDHIYHYDQCAAMLKTEIME